MSVSTVSIPICTAPKISSTRLTGTIYWLDSRQTRSTRKRKTGSNAIVSVATSRPSFTRMSAAIVTFMPIVSVTRSRPMISVSVTTRIVVATTTDGAIVIPFSTITATVAIRTTTSSTTAPVKKKIEEIQHNHFRMKI